MTRTKASKNTAAKRNRNSTSEESELSTALQELENRRARFIEEQNNKLEEQLNEFANTIYTFKMCMPKKLLEMKLVDFRMYNIDKQQQQAQIQQSDHSTVATISSTLGPPRHSSKKGKYSSDDGYLTEESGKSVRCGPLSSARARPRRSRSAQPLSSTLLSNNSQSVSKNYGQKNGEFHASRSRSKMTTPSNQRQRLQTMSADRGCLNPVTPKIMENIPIAIYRYPKEGETVISLSGSPVVVHRPVQSGVNINIPVGDKIFLMQPSAMTAIDPELRAGIDQNMMDQLRQLQRNINLIVNQSGK